MAGGDQIRLFCALQLPGEAVKALAAWQVLHMQQGRIVRPEHLHVTLAFLGSRARSEVGAIARELAEAAAAASPVRLAARNYRETGGVGMIVLADLDEGGSRLATGLVLRLETLGLHRREGRPWLPHVTVIRFRERPGLAPPLPELGEILAVRAALYSSTLRPTGARYDVLETVALGGR